MNILLDIDKQIILLQITSYLDNKKIEYNVKTNKKDSLIYINDIIIVIYDYGINIEGDVFEKKIDIRYEIYDFSKIEDILIKIFKFIELNFY